MLPDLPPAWAEPLADQADTLVALRDFLADDVAEILPPPDQIFRALEAVAPADVRVVILGQDPYPTPGHAEGLAFSAAANVRPFPRSLANIFKELASDLGISPTSPSLLPWAEQGVLLLNAVLTVRAGEADSHAGKGWELLTDAVIKHLAADHEGLAFVLWGKKAQKKAAMIDAARHLLIETAHPSPLSARRGFFGSRPFSRINEYRAGRGEAPIDWCLS